MTDHARLAELEARVQRELQMTSYPQPEWLEPQRHEGHDVVDVAIIGGGQAGLTIAFALSRRGIRNTIVLDAAPKGSEGPWTTYAAMKTLRTPKKLTGPDQGVPSLTPEAWYRAAFGDDAWDEMTFVPKEHWQAYLGWFRDITGARVRNEATVTGIEPSGDLLTVRLGDEVLVARRVVLASGITGNGVWNVPSVIADNLAADRYVHTGQVVDFARFEGQRVGVLGGGASAFDYAASALEQGASRVDLFYRRPRVPRVNPFRWMEFYAFGAHFADLPDEDKWRYCVHFGRTNQSPPQSSWDRCTRWENFNWHTAAGWHSVRMDGDDIVVDAGEDQHRFDAVISATGPNIDLALCPELSTLAPLVATWGDRFTAPQGWEDPALSRYPYLGPGFEFIERETGSASWVGRVFDFTFGARLSMGLIGTLNSGLGVGGHRIADSVSRSLFLEDRNQFFDSYCSYDEYELVDMERPQTAVGLPEEIDAPLPVSAS